MHSVQTDRNLLSEPGHYEIRQKQFFRLDFCLCLKLCSCNNVFFSKRKKTSTTEGRKLHQLFDKIMLTCTTVTSPALSIAADLSLGLIPTIPTAEGFKWAKIWQRENKQNSLRDDIDLARTSTAGF